MSDWYWYVAAAAAAYTAGSLNGALVVSLWFLRDDIRKHGSGNAGLTNTYRTLGPGWALFVMLWDTAKGVAAVLVCGMLLGDWGRLIAGAFVIAGHMFPVFFRFKGGKGIMTACGVFFALQPAVAAISLSAFIIIVLVTRYVSLGSIVAVALLAPMMWLFDMGLPHIVYSAAVAALIVYMHRGNIVRLVKGEERRFSFRTK